jgi:capsular polysaccharide biosynthesis protein
MQQSKVRKNLLLIIIITNMTIIIMLIIRFKLLNKFILEPPSFFIFFLVQNDTIFLKKLQAFFEKNIFLLIFIKILAFKRDLR